jgi:hypothetical protein
MVGGCEVVMRMGRRVRGLLRPGVVIPSTLSLALLVALLAFGNSRDILAEVAGFQWRYVLWYALLALVAEAARAVQWHMMLEALDVGIPLRRQGISFLAGELTKGLPLGNYFPNYVLRQSDGANFGLTSAASTAIVVLEAVVSLGALALLGLGSWTGWLRPLILAGAGSAAVAGWVLARWRGGAHMSKWMTRGRGRRRLARELAQFRGGAARLARPRVLAIGALLCATEITAAAAGLFVITRGLGVHGVSFYDVLAVYCFTLALALIGPSVVDLGIFEAGGVGAFLVVGLARDPAISAMLINRLLGIATVFVIAGVAAICGRRELWRALRGKRGRQRMSSMPMPAAMDLAAGAQAPSGAD